jgi:hypothetical protein
MNFIGIWVIWIGMPDTMLTHALHNATITTPVLRPIFHVMIARIVNTAILAFAFLFIVD